MTWIVFQSTPSAWRETRSEACEPVNSVFQSTPSAWRETRSEACEPVNSVFQSTPSAWRETSAMEYLIQLGIISIHSLRMEGDSPLGHNSGRGDVFQSTPSAWRETQGRPAIYRRSFISIHSLRMEGDFTTVIAFYFGTHFNPLPPHGGRPFVVFKTFY